MRAALLLATLALAGCADASRPRRPSAPTAAIEWVDVLVEASGERLLGCDGPWVARDAGGRQVGAGERLEADSPVAVSRQIVAVGHLVLGAPPVEIQPRGGATVSIDGVRYRGGLLLEYDMRRGAPRLFNRVRLEDYLLGVVPAEMPDRFGFEALKAQAVAARSYALAEVADRGWLYADTRSQAYGGRGRESPLSTRAVRETTGEVLMHAGRPLKAWYHSTCGGRTLPAAEAFEGVPAGAYRRPVACPDCRDSPHHSWERRLEAERVCAAMDLPLAELERVSVTSTGFPSRGGSIQITAGGRQASLPMAEFRRRLSEGRPLAEQVLSTHLVASPTIEDGRLWVAGRGWGHGVGLCQYGAAGFAARGGDHRAILARYYEGVEVVRLP